MLCSFSIIPWKQARAAECKQPRISAIYKKGKRDLAGTYRPVALTSIVSKMFECIMTSHMQWQRERCMILNDNNLIRTQQIQIQESSITT